MRVVIGTVCSTRPRRTEPALLPHCCRISREAMGRSDVDMGTGFTARFPHDRVTAVVPRDDVDSTSAREVNLSEWPLCSTESARTF